MSAQEDGAGEVHGIDKGVRGRYGRVVGPAQHHGHHVHGQGLEEFLRHVVFAWKEEESRDRGGEEGDGETNAKREKGGHLTKRKRGENRKQKKENGLDIKKGKKKEKK